jgi:hypothetical protein
LTLGGCELRRVALDGYLVVFGGASDRHCCMVWC